MQPDDRNEFRTLFSPMSDDSDLNETQLPASSSYEVLPDSSDSPDVDFAGMTLDDALHHHHFECTPPKVVPYRVADGGEATTPDSVKGYPLWHLMGSTPRRPSTGLQRTDRMQPCIVHLDVVVLFVVGV